MNEKYKLYGYRWVVLTVFMLINLTMQTLWITYAPITGPAAADQVEESELTKVQAPWQPAKATNQLKQPAPAKATS